MDRSTQLLEIRPTIQSAKIIDNMGNIELFQNSALRPILKYQNHLILAVFKNYVAKHKNSFYELAVQKKLAFIENAVQKDIKFRNSLKGIIIGLFTLEEYEIYIQDSSALNKRMMNMVIERLKDQIQVFELPVLV